MKSTLLALALAALPACGAGPTNDAVMHPRDAAATMIPAPPPGTSFARWEYLCLTSGKKDDLNLAGQRGWELVSVAADVYTRYGEDTQSTLIYCFKRPLEDGLALTLDEAVQDGGSAGDELVRDVAREFVDSIAAQPAAFLGTSRAVPRIVGVEPIGLELRAIEPGSPVAALGLRTGDIVTEIGDRDLDDVDDILAAWLAMRMQPDVHINYIRDRVKHTLVVRLR
jgi:hypothetical protein